MKFPTVVLRGLPGVPPHREEKMSSTMKVQNEALHVDLERGWCGACPVVVYEGCFGNGSGSAPLPGEQLPPPTEIIYIEDDSVESVELSGRGRRLTSADFIGSSRVLCIRRRLYAFRSLQDASLCSSLVYTSVRNGTPTRVGVLDPVTPEVLLFGNASLMPEEQLLLIPRPTVPPDAEIVKSGGPFSGNIPQQPSCPLGDSSLPPSACLTHEEVMQFGLEPEVNTWAPGAGVSDVLEERRGEFDVGHYSRESIQTNEAAQGVTNAGLETSKPEEANHVEGGALPLENAPGEAAGSLLCFATSSEEMDDQRDNKQNAMKESIQSYAVTRKRTNCQLQLLNPVVPSSGEVTCTSLLSESYPLGERLTRFSCDLVSLFTSKMGRLASSVLQDVYGLCERHQYLIHYDANLGDVYRQLQLFRAHSATCQVLDEAGQITAALSTTTGPKFENKGGVTELRCTPPLEKRSSQKLKKLKRGRIVAGLANQAERQLGRQRGKGQVSARQKRSPQNKVKQEDAKEEVKETKRRTVQPLQGIQSTVYVKPSKSTYIWEKASKISGADMVHTPNATKANMQYSPKAFRGKTALGVAKEAGTTSHALGANISRLLKLSSQEAQLNGFNRMPRKVPECSELTSGSNLRRLALQSGETINNCRFATFGWACAAWFSL